MADASSSKAVHRSTGLSRRVIETFSVIIWMLQISDFKLQIPGFRLLPADYADLRGFVHIPSLGGAWGGSPFPFHLSFPLSSFPETERKATKNIWKRGATAGVASKYLQTHFASFRLRVPRLPGNRLRAFASSRTPEIPSVRGKIFAVTWLKFRSNAAKIP